MQLSDRLGAVRFSIDEWMTTLFWMDTPQPLDLSWSMTRVERCYTQMWATALQVSRLGIPSVLDLGFSSLANRKRYAEMARDAGLKVQLHFLDVPAEERWRRVTIRNIGEGKTSQLTFAITREMFDQVDGLWEPPNDDEMLACDGIRISGT